MKGISPVIATILLLLIAIGVTGTAYVWLTSSQSSMQQSASQQMSNLVSKAGYGAQVISAECFNNTSGNETINVTIRNVGTKPINVSKNAEIYIIVNDPQTGATKITQKIVDSTESGTIQPNNDATLTFTWPGSENALEVGETTSFKISFSEGFDVTGTCVVKE